MSGRDTVLARVRAALGEGAAAGEPVSMARTYRRVDEAARDAIMERFVRRVGDYGAAVHRVPAERLSATIGEVCGRRGGGAFVIPADLPADWLPDGLERLSDDGGLDYRQLDRSAGVITGCAVAVAETGTIMLDGGAGQGRRAITLLPDYHLCVVRADQIVGLVPEAIARLADAGRAGRPVTLISGPSATADIELSRVQGVHGPRTLEVIIVDGPVSA
jgi:L-lactate dehydrogenase complex protein LldG